MIIESAKQVALKTHLAAIANQTRASGLYLVSGPGLGKSESVVQQVEDLAKSLQKPVGLVTEMLASYSSVDVRGFMLPVKTADGTLGTVWSRPSWYPVKENTRVAEPVRQPNGVVEIVWHEMGAWDKPMPAIGCLFLDEWAQADEESQKPAAELLLNGRVGTTVLPIGWRVIAAGNRTSDRSGVARELMFLVNRRCRLEIEPSLPAWLDWANSQPQQTRPHHLTISFSQQHPGIVFRDTVPETDEPFCTPRTLCLMDRDLMALRTQTDIQHDRLPMDDVAREVCAGWIGQAATAQFFTHLRFAEELPELSDIEADPTRAKLPKGMDAQMVVAYFLPHRLTKDNVAAILQYTMRLQPEMQLLTINTMSAIDKIFRLIYTTSEYRRLIEKHKDMIIGSRM